MKYVILLFSCFFAFICSAQKTIGSIERLDPKINLLIDNNAKVEILADGFNWAEGPVWVPELDAVLFTDVPENIIYQWNKTNGLSVFLSPSGYTGYAPNEKKAGGNGLILDKKGNLLIAQHGDRRIAKITRPLDEKKPFITVVDKYNKKRFHSPNDLILDQEGRLYFTDPPYGLKGDNDPLRELTHNSVYRHDPSGEVKELITTLNRPNGLAFSPDESVLYVANSDKNRNLWMAYDLVEGELTNERVFFDATKIKRPGLADGLKVHSSGTIFATGPGGVLVFSPEGKHLGTIVTEVRTANCAFNSDESALFMTSDRYLTRIQLKK